MMQWQMEERERERKRERGRNVSVKVKVSLECHTTAILDTHFSKLITFHSDAWLKKVTGCILLRWPVVTQTNLLSLLSSSLLVSPRLSLSLSLFGCSSSSTKSTTDECRVIRSAEKVR
jgi:hypothetical protein